MTDHPVDKAALISAARNGEAAALDQLLAMYRDRLRAAADRRLNAMLRRRLDASDIVQQTCVDAYRGFRQFAGSTEAELLAWLHRILERKLADAARDQQFAQKRAIGREISLDATHHEPGAFSEAVALDGSSPSRKAIRNENELRLRRALESLPDDQREAVRLRHLEGLPLHEIATRLHRNTTATAALIHRGIKALRTLLSDSSRGTD